MLRIVTLIICAVLACDAIAAEDRFTPAVLSVSAPDLERSGERLAAGPYGAIWRLPEVQRLRLELLGIPGFDPAWLSLAGHAGEARFILRLPVQGSPDPPDVRLALRAPPGLDPVPPPQLAARRQDTWWILGLPDAQLELPPQTAGPADADLRVRLDLTAIAAALPRAAAAPYVDVLGILGLSSIDGEAVALADGLAERVRMPGAVLPLRPVDPEVLAGVPDAPLGVCAIGIDGRALAGMVHAIAAAVGATERVDAADAALRTWIGVGLDDLLLACDGTSYCVTTQAVPFPAMTLSVPASASGDALVAGLLGLARLDGRALVDESRRQTVAVTLPRMPVPLALRRTASRIICGSDAAMVDRLAAPAAAPFRPASMWTDADGAVALSYGDSRAQAQLLVGVLPMALMQVSDDDLRRRLGSVQQAIIAALPHLRPATMVVRRDADGFRLDGREAMVTDIMPLSVGAGMLLPAIQQVRESARRAQSSSNMRQICLAMLAYGAENDGRWPASIAAVREWSEGELADAVFRSPSRPDIAEPYLYVRPDLRAKADQPVLVQDPACNRGRGSLVVYADGHVAFVQGGALWAEAQRLAVQPKAAVPQQGIAMSDWTVDTVSGQPAGAGAPADPKASF